jgi:Tfp pilus assembly protein PilO
MDEKKVKQLKLNLKEYSSLLPPFIAIVVLLFLLTRFLLPQILVVKNEMASIDENKKIVAQLEEKLEILSEYELEELVEFVKKANILIPVNEDLSSLILYLKSIEQETSVSVDSFDVKPGKEVLFTLELSGEKEQILEFLSNLGKTDRRIITLKSISSKKDKEKKVFTVKITANAAYQSYIKEIGKVEDKIEKLTSEQRKLVERIKSLEIPVAGELEVVDIEERENPFSL